MAVTGLATIAIVVLVARGWIFEQWNIYRFNHGGMESRNRALEWMAEKGGEDSMIALDGWCSSYSWQILLIPDLTKSELDQNLPPATRKRLSGIYQHLEQAAASVSDLVVGAMNKIQERLGESAMVKIRMKLLSGAKTPGRLLVSMARSAIVIGPSLGLGPGAVDLAVRRLRECLADPDPLVRTGAANGLADAGERAGPGAIEALTALEHDSDEVVREAATCAVGRLKAAAGRN
jgi:HEAT repeat protein